MTDAHVAAVQEVRQRQQEYEADPSARPVLLQPCKIKILMVTDGVGAFVVGSFGVADFGLRALLGELAVPPNPWVRFEVTKAHRRTDPNAHISDFRFDTIDLSQYDGRSLVVIATRLDLGPSRGLTSSFAGRPGAVPDARDQLTSPRPRSSRVAMTV
jgi:hypothetical protein